MDKRIREMCQYIDSAKKLSASQEGVTEWAEKLLDENDSLKIQLAEHKDRIAVMAKRIIELEGEDRVGR